MDDRRLAYLFMDVLQEPIRSSVKAMEPSTLSMSIQKQKLLEGLNYPKGFITKNPMIGIPKINANKEFTRSKPLLSIQKPTNRLDHTTHEVLRKKNLFFNF